jgi:predicted transcriptional regulator
MAVDPHAILSLAAEIVSAHVSNNRVGPEQLPKLINDVHHALTTAELTATELPKPEPAVPVKKSILRDHLVCLDCGRHFSMLKRHIATDHHLTPEQYRQRWDLPRSYPLVAPDYTKTRSRLAKKIGLGRIVTVSARRRRPLKAASAS